jgi:transposase
MTHITGHDRSQTLLLPESLDDYIGPENPVRFIEVFVDGLDLAASEFARVASKETGRSGYASANMLKLYIYGYLSRIRSSCQLEAETHRNIEVIWLLRHLKPDFKTIADIRRDNRNAFRAVFRRQFRSVSRMENEAVLDRMAFRLAQRRASSIDAGTRSPVYSLIKGFTGHRCAERCHELESGAAIPACGHESRRTAHRLAAHAPRPPLQPGHGR